MLKPGDTVRYLNDVGGGIVTRVDGKMAYVEDNGFETPVLASDLVVVLPAGHEPAARGAKLMFDQSARDAATSRKPEPAPAPAATHTPELPAPDTDHGDKLSVAIAFEPASTRDLSRSSFNTVLVNDSNYWLDFCFSRRGDDERRWTVVFQGTLPPNELMDLCSLTHEQLPGMERIALQAFAYKKEKDFELKPVIDITRRLDLTKFHKLHCFRPGIYFDTPVMEVQLIKDDELQGRNNTKQSRTREQDVSLLAEKYKVDTRETKKRKPADTNNPHKLLQPVEVDLHIAQLLDNTAGMDNTAMMQVQLDTVRRVMKEHSRRIGQKIIFIHGKGDGVLRKGVLALLRKEFPKATTQDASFREYGFGATLVTIH